MEFEPVLASISNQEFATVGLILFLAIVGIGMLHGIVRYRRTNRNEGSNRQKPSNGGRRTR